jgi:hypothetical protein
MVRKELPALVVFKKLLDIFCDIPDAAFSRIGDAVVKDDRDSREKKLDFKTARFIRLLGSSEAIRLVNEEMTHAPITKCGIAKQRERLALQVGSGNPVIQENAFEFLESLSLHVVDIAELGIERDPEFRGLGDGPLQLISDPQFLPRAAAA